MADYINDREVMKKAMAYAVKAMEGLPAQLQDRELKKRFEGVLYIAEMDDDKRKALLKEADRRLNGLGS